MLPGARAMHVLVVDDDRTFLELVTARLRAHGVEVTVGQDAMQALMLAMRRPPDAIILDVMMPGGSGLNALKQLKASSKTSAVPVLVCSTLDDPALPERLRAMGASGFVRKPVKADAIVAALAQVLGLSPTPAAVG